MAYHRVKVGYAVFNFSVLKEKSIQKEIRAIQCKTSMSSLDEMSYLQLFKKILLGDVIY